MSKFKKVEKAVNELSLKQIEALPSWALDGTQTTPDWGIKQETCEHFGVKVFFPTTEQKVTGIYFPVTKRKQIVGYVKVNPSLSKNGGRFTIVGDVSIDCELVGQNVARRSKKLFIVEGMKDLLTAFQVLREGGSAYAGKDVIPSVVTFALGIGDPSKGMTNARQAIANNLEFVEGYSEIITCFDNDDHNEIGKYNVGQEGVKDCALVLKDFKNVLLSTNDIHDLYKDEGADKVYRKLMFDAKPFELGSISTGITDTEALMQPLKKGIYLDALPDTMRLLHGLREREFTVILAPPKCGKTSLCKLINYHLILHGQKTLGCYLEEDLVKTRQSMIALHTNTHLPRFRENPACADPEKVKEAMEILSSDACMFYDDRVGKMKPEDVIPTFEWAAIKGAKFIVLDHLSFVFSGDSNQNERKGIDNLLTDIAAFVKKTGVHVIAVAHITRDKNKPKPKDKEGNIKYPYWYEVEETDGRGSGAFEQVCWNMIAIDKEVTEDKSRGKTRTKILYNREWDNTGIGDVLTMNPMTGRLQAVEAESY